MKINSKGLLLIKQFEGCVLHAYDDGYGNLTIGWGHCGSDVYKGQVLTQAEADALLISDIKKYEDNVNKYMSTYFFNTNEFSALVSFAYNIGSIDELVHEGRCTREEIRNRIPLYCHAGDQVVEGLQRRREAELALFNEPLDKKDIPHYFNQIANTLLGKYGVDQERKDKLGNDYDIVQDSINELYNYLRRRI